MPEETKWNFLNILEWGLFVTAGPLLEQSGVQQGVNVGGSPTDRLGCTPSSSLFEYLRKRQNFNLVGCLKRGYKHKEKSKQRIRNLQVGQNQQLFLTFRVRGVNVGGNPIRQIG